MLIDATHPEEVRVVVMEGNRLEEFDFEVANKKQLKGNIYLAKVTRVEPSLQASFIEYGGNRHGFLAFSEIHPDYYRIPASDREALMREAAEMRLEEDEDLEDETAQEQDITEEKSEPHQAEAIDQAPISSSPVSPSPVAPEEGRPQEAETALAPVYAQEDDVPQLAGTDKAPSDTDSQTSQEALPDAASDIVEAPGAENTLAPNTEALEKDQSLATEAPASEETPEAPGAAEHQDSAPHPHPHPRALEAEEDPQDDDPSPPRAQAESAGTDPDQIAESPADSEHLDRAETDTDHNSVPEPIAPDHNALASERSVSSETDATVPAFEAPANLPAEPILAENAPMDAHTPEESSEFIQTEAGPLAPLTASEEPAPNTPQDTAQDLPHNAPTSLADAVPSLASLETSPQEDIVPLASDASTDTGPTAENQTPETAQEEGLNGEILPPDTTAEEVSFSEEDGERQNRQRRSRYNRRNGRGDKDGETREKRVAFHRRYKIQDVIKRRQIILVQVVKEERGNKGAALTTYLSLAGRYCVLMPNTARGGGVSRKITSASDRKRLKTILDELEIPEGMAVIVRTAGAERSKAEIRRDYEYLLRLWEDIRERTLESISPTLVHEEANLIKRSIRDLYSRDIDEVLVEGEAGYKIAKNFMKMLMPSHAKRVQLYTEPVPLFHRYQVENQLDAIHSTTVQLRSGGYIVLNPTEALVSIDVNSGRSTRERHIEETAVKTNLEAAEEIGRQLRLRDLAGLIVIDFIDMEDNRHIGQVERKLRDAVKNDRARIQIGRISSFGLMEMSRQRMRPSLQEIVLQECPTCAGTGFVRSVESTALHVLRAIEDEGLRGRSAEIALYVPTQVALYILNQKRSVLMEKEARYDFTVYVYGDDSLIPPNYRLEKLLSKSPEQIANQQQPSLLPPPPRTDAPLEADEDTLEARETSEEQDDRQDRRRRKSRQRRRRDEERSETDIENKDIDSEEQPLAAQDASALDEEEDEEDEDGRRRRRRRGKRGGRRRRKSDDDTSLEAQEEDNSETHEDESFQSEDTQNGQGTIASETDMVSATTEEMSDENLSSESPEDIPEEETARPKRRRRTSSRSRKTTNASEGLETDKAPDETGEEEKTKPRRKRTTRTRRGRVYNTENDAKSSETTNNTTLPQLEETSSSEGDMPAAENTEDAPQPHQADASLYISAGRNAVGITVDSSATTGVYRLSEDNAKKDENAPAAAPSTNVKDDNTTETPPAEESKAEPKKRGWWNLIRS